LPAAIDTAPRPALTAASVRPLDAAAVHAEHGSTVWSALQRLGVRDADLDDVYQEVFVVVHQRLHTYDPDVGSVAAWLFGICVRVAGAHRRRAHLRRERVTDTPDAAHATPSVAPDATPESQAEARQSRAQLRAILDEMDLERRAVFVMYEIDEL
jgi:RNA polymerase sigma-70 factor (ECF subfamily)